MASEVGSPVSYDCSRPLAREILQNVAQMSPFHSPSMLPKVRLFGILLSPEKLGTLSPGKDADLDRDRLVCWKGFELFQLWLQYCYSKCLVDIVFIHHDHGHWAALVMS